MPCPSGVFASELLGLRVGDLVRHDGRWFLRLLAPSHGGGAKGSRERLVPFPQARELRAYLAGPRLHLDAASDHEDGIPRALEGDCVVLVRDDDDDRDVETLYIPVSGLPETLDEQLDSALSAAGWRRTEDIRSWTDQDVAHGRCAVVRASR